jgi:exodeoxyribonuclease V alpha subunit
VDRLNGTAEEWLAEAGAISLDGDWPAGQPVMVTRNDKQLGLSNGDVGVVCEGDGGRQAWFPVEDGVRGLAPPMLPEHDKVYATTVHKSQGSEYDEVFLVLPMEDSPLLTRELLYTAVTRAKGKVTILGPEAVVRAAVTRKGKRVSGLGELLNGGNDRDQA